MVYTLISPLKSKTSAGFDEISSKLLKLCIIEICQHLTGVINQSLTQGIFHAKLKVSEVFWLHKLGSKKELQNIRPIYLDSTASKNI